ncbi:MAG: hypothetical protein LLG02_10965 [Pelosinus sp.]|nr:hypothetical protein [Pelosinus sp.]
MDSYIRNIFNGDMIKTGPLKESLKETKDINSFLKENTTSITDPTLSEHLNRLLSQKGLKRKVVIESAHLDINYASQFFNKQKSNPSREHVLSLAFGFGLNNEEADRLLKIAGVGALYSKNKRDAVIIYALENGMSIDQTDDILIDHNLEPLDKDINNKR